MPLDADEICAAGGIRGEPIAMVRATTQDALVPADAEIVLEGSISATDTVHEGPFGEFLGYYSDEGPSPVVTIDAVTHRREPVYVAINGAGRETVMLRKHVLETAAFSALRAATPIVKDVNLTAGGLHRFHLVVSIARQSRQQDGLQRNAAMAAFGALKDLDLVVLVDDDIDVHDLYDVEYAIATRVEGSRDVVVVPGARGHEYIRVSDGGVRAKVIIDATVPYDDRDRFRRVAFADVELDPSRMSTTPGSETLSWLTAGG
jgi:2,5-furandicarboxylate decarboxylase 1